MELKENWQGSFYIGSFFFVLRLGDLLRRNRFLAFLVKLGRVVLCHVALRYVVFCVVLSGRIMFLSPHIICYRFILLY